MRRLGYLLLAACFCLPIVGCSGDAAAPATDETTVPEGGDAGSGSSEAAEGGEVAAEEAPAE